MSSVSRTVPPNLLLFIFFDNVKAGVPIHPPLALSLGKQFIYTRMNKEEKGKKVKKRGTAVDSRPGSSRFTSCHMVVRVMPRTISYIVHDQA
jgi:hypothetical protein